MSVFLGSRYATGTAARILANGQAQTTLFRGPSPYPAADTGRYYLAVDGDRLDRLAKRYYGSANLWWVIADANDGLLPDPLIPGTMIRIPDVASIG